MDLGITHLDTSNVYGLGFSERRIGAFLEQYGQQDRDFSQSLLSARIASEPDGPASGSADLNLTRGLVLSRQMHRRSIARTAEAPLIPWLRRHKDGYNHKPRRGPKWRSATRRAQDNHAA